MLLAFAVYDYNFMYYSVYDGSSWPGGFTLNNIGWSSNTVKQISSDTVHDPRINATNPTMAYIAYLTSGNSGTLKVAAFYGNGTFKGIETADSTLSHKLPSITANKDGGVRIYSISGSNIYLTQRNATGWLPPTAPYGASLGAPDQLTSQLGGSFKTGVLWASGSAGNYTVRYDGTADAIAIPIPRSYPYVAIYHDTPSFAIYGAKTTCNFSGTNRTQIQSNNYLTCMESLQTPTHNVDHEDWGYQAYVTLKQTGNLVVGADVWKGCEFLLFYNSCSGTSAGLYDHKYNQTITISNGTSDDVTVFMEWNSTNPNSTNAVKWYYQIKNGPKTQFASFVKEPQENSAFNTGTAWFIARYFQAGIGSAYNIGHDGWNVYVKNPAYATSVGGGYHSFYYPAKATDGVHSYWDATFAWGGQVYSGVDGEYYCKNIANPSGQVRFHYTGTTLANDQKLWGGC